MARHHSRRVVITGIGMASPLGCGSNLAWGRLLAGDSGVRALPASVFGDLPSAIAGLVPDAADDPDGGLRVDRVVAARDLKKLDRFIQLGLVATDEAMRQAGLSALQGEAAARTATVIASGVGGFPAIADAVRIAESRGVRRLISTEQSGALH